MSDLTVTQSRAAALYERAQKVMPGGCSRNTILRKPHPLYVENGASCYVTDVEGVTRIDFANNMASLIHGHAHPTVVEAVSKLSDSMELQYSLSIDVSQSGEDTLAVRVTDLFDNQAVAKLVVR